MRVHSRVMLCVCFCGLTAIAPGLINILVSHEDIGAYRQAAKGGIWEGKLDVFRQALWARLRSVPVCNNTAPFITPIYMHGQKARASWWAQCNAWKARCGLWSLVGTSFMFGSELLRDFDDIPRTIGDLCMVICGQMHLFIIVWYCVEKEAVFIFFWGAQSDVRSKAKLSLISKHPSIPNLKFDIILLIAEIVI